MKELPSNKEEKPLKISTPDEIRAIKKQAEEGVIKELPSGLRVKLRRPKLAVMIKQGVIPQELMAVALQVAGGQKISDPANVGKAMEIIEIMLMNTFVEPKLVKENPSDEQIGIDDLDDDDRGFVVTYAQDGEVGLRRFLERLKTGQ